MTNPARTTLAALGFVALVASAAAGCTDPAATPAADAPTTATSSSAAAEPVTLRLGTDDDADTPGGEQVQHFADEVAERSGGSITIEPVWHAGDGQSHWDQVVAGKVGNGELDLGMVPTRAWDDLGVTSLRALNTPFLITTDALTEAVVTDDALVEQLTSGLPDAGVTALGLFPEGLRHPFGFDRVLGGPADYDGGVVRSAYSRTTEAVFAALGATLSDEDADPTTMIGAESSFRLTPAGQATGNVVFYPKVNSLVLSEDARADLDAEQIDVLQASADATQGWVLDTLPSDAEAAATFCDEAGRIGAAAPDDLEALVVATRGLVDELRKDPTTAAVIDGIERLAADEPPAEPVTGCPDGAVANTSAVDGTYAFTVTPEQARAAGATDEGTIANNTGDFVVTLEGGTWEMQQVYAIGPDAGTTWTGTGGFTLDGERFTWYWTHDGQDYTEADVRVDDDGSLVFSAVDDAGDAEAQALSDATFTTWAPQD